MPRERRDRLDVPGVHGCGGRCGQWVPVQRCQQAADGGRVEVGARFVEVHPGVDPEEEPVDVGQHQAVRRPERDGQGNAPPHHLRLQPDLDRHRVLVEGGEQLLDGEPPAVGDEQPDDAHLPAGRQAGGLDERPQTVCRGGTFDPLPQVVRVADGAALHDPHTCSVRSREAGAEGKIRHRRPSKVTERGCADRCGRTCDHSRRFAMSDHTLKHIDHQPPRAAPWGRPGSWQHGGVTTSSAGPAATAGDTAPTTATPIAATSGTSRSDRSTAGTAALRRAAGAAPLRGRAEPRAAARRGRVAAPPAASPAPCPACAS